MEKQPFSWKARGRSFKYAWRGICLLVAGEHNARLHLCAAIVAVALGIWLDISATEWAVVSLCIGGVLAAEGFNSAIEAACDRMGSERHPLVARAKDMAAGAVLLAALGALGAGVAIFLPKLIAICAG